MSRYVYSFTGIAKEKRYKGKLVATGSLNALGQLQDHLSYASIDLVEIIDERELPIGIIKMEEVTDDKLSIDNKEEPETTRQPNPYVQAVRRLCHIPVGSIFQLGRCQYVKIANHRMTDRNDIDTLGPNAINLENGHQVALLTYLKVQVLSFNG